MDEEIRNWTKDELIAEVMRLRAGIRAHRDSSGHEYAGIIQSFGVCFPNRFRGMSQSQPGLSSTRLGQIPGGARPGTCRCYAHRWRVQHLKTKGSEPYDARVLAMDPIDQIVIGPGLVSALGYCGVSTWPCPTRLQSYRHKMILNIFFERF
jgi:hypothetical protein